MRERRLRWPIAPGLERSVRGQHLKAIERRAKYLLLRLERGTLLLHLGMSGSVRLLDPALPARPHDHWDLIVEGSLALRFHDPRRFGSLHWTEGPPETHPLLAALAPEPLSAAFNAEYLYKATRRRRVALKQLLMNSRIVVGVGNIYASEALFRARLSPRRAAQRLTRAQAQALVTAVKDVLRQAIRTGGTTLRDYVNADGEPGYFRQKLFVYERAGKPCRICATPIQQRTQGQRSTYWCPRCQR